MKKFLLITGIVLLLLCILFWQLVLPIPTGYAAKCMCSALFVAGMDEPFIEEHDLNYSLVALTTNSVNVEDSSVRSTFLGLKPQVAVFRNKAFGCTLKGKETSDQLEVPVPEIRVPQPPPDSASFRVSVASPALNRAIAEIMKDEFANNAIETRAMVVVYNGEILGEQYASPFDSNSVFLGWSMAKSVTATLVGFLAQRGLVDIDAPVPVEEWQDDPVRSLITWKDLLQMRSGLKWSEVYSWISDATKMLYTKGDTYAYAIRSKSESEPGGQWEYSSGTTNILSGLVRKVIGDDTDYWAFPQTALSGPLGMRRFIMEVDAAGNFVGSSYIYATARDWARFGLLYLNGGEWNGKQLLPKDWVDFVMTPAPDSGDRYGGQFWLNKSGTLPDVPRDLYYADGYQHQRVFIIPSKDLVVVRLGLSIHEKPDYNALLSRIIQAVDASAQQ